MNFLRVLGTTINDSIIEELNKLTMGLRKTRREGFKSQRIKMGYSDLGG